MVSHEAARVAAKLGYSNVFVMTDGIKGWEKAGLPVETGASGRQGESTLPPQVTPSS